MRIDTNKFFTHRIKPDLTKFALYPFIREMVGLKCNIKRHLRKGTYVQIIIYRPDSNRWMEILMLRSEIERV